MRQSREECHARMHLSDVYEIFMEAKRENRWDGERECFVDPQGNPSVDPQKVNFEALVVAIPTAGVWAANCEDPKCRKEVEEGIRRVICASVEKKKNVEEIVEESKKMVDELKKTVEKAGDEKLKSSAEETVAEKQQVIKEDQNQMAKEATVPNAEVITETESSISSYKIEIKTEVQCRKCMETCSSCTKKDENLRSINIELTKIEHIFKEKCIEMLENEKFFKQKEEEIDTEM
ncbi:hypothetical protein Hanom_Chr15g01403251 [Helianthus anomalus]